MYREEDVGFSRQTRWNVKAILAALLIHFLFILHCALKRNNNPGYLRNKLFYCLYLILEMA